MCSAGDFFADGLWRKFGADAAEFSQPWGKVRLALVCDFGSKDMAAWAIVRHSDMVQQREMLGTLLGKAPEGARPVVACDMTGQHRHKGCWRALEEARAIKSMFRKDNCIDDGATEQVPGHIRDEFFRNQN